MMVGGKSRRVILRKVFRHFSNESNPNRPLIRNASINSSFTLSHTGETLSAEEDNGDSASPELPGSHLTRTLSNSLIGENVHASYSSKKEKDRWRKRPLFNRGGIQAVFKTGTDAANLLVQEARRRDPYQGDFLDAIEDIVYDIAPLIEEDPRRAWIFKQLMEPEYSSTFRVPWKDDSHNSRINRGILILLSNSQKKYNGDAIVSANLSHGLGRMLGWENNLRCALAVKEENDCKTTALGGMMLGSDFDPIDKSEAEVMAFCQSFIQTLAPLVTNVTDACYVECGRYVGRREIKYLKQAYEMNYGSDATPLFGSSALYPEFKGYGTVYFAEQAIQANFGKSLSGLSCLVSGSGLLSRNIAKKLLDKGAIPKSFSDDSGILYCKNGLNEDIINSVGNFRAQNLPLSDYAKMASSPDIQFFSDTNIYRHQGVEADLVFASRGMGEMNVDDACFLEEHDVMAVFECTHKGITTNARLLLQDREVLFAPAKAVAAGQTVATRFLSDYESKHSTWPTKQEVENEVSQRMAEIYNEIAEIAELYNVPGNLKAGANLLSFLRVAKRETL